MSNWEKGLAKGDFNHIDSKLVACGIDPLKTSVLADALLEYFKSTVVGSDTERFVRFMNEERFHEAREVLMKIVSSLTATDAPYCSPMKLTSTWGEGTMQSKLVAARAVVDRAFITDPEPRTPRIMAFYSGTGNGKTHMLLEAGRLLGADITIYITYNMDQSLEFDQNQPRIAICLRVLMRFLGVTNRACSEWFERNKTSLVGLNLNLLTKAFAGYLEHQHVYIGVDEIRKLMKSESDNTTVQTMTSQLGILAVELQSVGVKCSILVSALTEATFKTITDRDVQLVFMTPPDESTREDVVKELLPGATEQQNCMLAAAAGTHFRSMVVGCLAMKQNFEITVEGLYKEIRDRLWTRLDDDDRTCIATYVKQSVDVGFKDACSKATPFLDATSTIAPAYVYEAFNGRDGFASLQHPALRVFGVSQFTDTTKQLERAAMAYDQFRALYGLRVVPHAVRVVATPSEKGMAWFNSLKFSQDVATNVDTAALFKYNAITKKVERTAFVPTFNVYCLPSNPSHPLIDRACMARTAQGEDCLVIYQDRINAAGFAKAVNQLNEAASALKKEMCVPVLCIAHVIGASGDTTAQCAFQHPYILVREPDIVTFYTPTFAPAIRHLSSRHVLAHVAGQEVNDTSPKDAGKN
jgi:hypothetical protein